MTNSTLNLLHVKTTAETDDGLATRMVTYTVVMLLGLVVIHAVSRSLNLPAVTPWGIEKSTGPVPDP